MNLERTGSEMFTTCAETMYRQVCQKRRRGALAFFLDISEKPEEVSNKHPRRVARVKTIYYPIIHECPIKI